MKSFMHMATIYAANESLDRLERRHAVAEDHRQTIKPAEDDDRDRKHGGKRQEPAALSFADAGLLAGF